MNDTQAQARPKRPALEEVEAYVRGKGYDDRGSANAFYGNFFYAYHDARAWRRADGTPVLDWRAEADGWHEMGPHYLEPEHPARGARSDSGASGARARGPGCNSRAASRRRRPASARDRGRSRPRRDRSRVP